ncbi:fibronectin type III and SPRY domain-containing 2 [Pelobates cultripes]|uniref:Fibronectin type III and SPRY domain-containing 2 n=1 Tax=Pelobates cultripes TaxID=61616 RepID=A0AAD1RNW5_PELCU|nr:fibronectin type III and SPRY domain-containing 2 [Pelobates cultripes]
MMDSDVLDTSEVFSPEDTDTVNHEEGGQYEIAQEDNEPEPEGLTFYHTDLYDSQGRLQLFPEDFNLHQAEEKLNQQVVVEKWTFSTEQAQLNLQKEVDELAKQYGLSEDKEEEELIQFFPQTTFKHPDPSLPKSTNPYTQKIQPFYKQNISPHVQDAELKVKKEGHFHDDKEIKEDSNLKNDRESLDNKNDERNMELEDKHFDNKGEPLLEQEGEESQPKLGHVDYVDGQREDGRKDRQREHDDENSGDHKGEEQEFKENYSDQKSKHTDHDKNQASMVSTDEISDGSELPESPDIFCITCKTPVRAFDKLFGFHKDHDVTQITAAVDNIKEEIHKNMTKLEEQIVQMENFASHLEEIFITIDENFVRQEQNVEMHYSEIMDVLAQKHEDNVQALGDEKKLKLESLFEQLIDSGKSLDTSKDLMETIQNLFKGKEKVEFVKTALDTTNRLNAYLNKDLDLNISTNAEFKNSSVDFSEVEQLLDSINIIPAPSAPVLNPQTPNSATATSLRVCWSLFSDDTVESYHLYFKPVSDGTPGEDQGECMIRAKETYCTVKDLMPNTQYEFWVIAINITGGSPASERAVYVTAPSPPIIKSEVCSSCENAALICWDSGNINPVDSYTVEIYNVTKGENEALLTESIVGIPICESLIQLKPRETYHISVRAVNVGGPSESSKSVSIHTTGTFFHLNEDTAHPLLSISDNGFTLSCDVEESLADLPYTCNTFTRCIAVMANLIPYKGKHYWEVELDEHTEYRVGVAYDDTNKNGLIGGNNTSWCFRHVLTPARHKYEFLHCGMSPDIRITVPPTRIGILLDYDHQKLSFYNMEILQHLFTFDCHFQHLVHPCFALEKPGTLKIHNGIPIPHSVNLF